VAHEKIRIDAANPNDDLIQIKNLKKVNVHSFLYVYINTWYHRSTEVGLEDQ